MPLSEDEKFDMVAALCAQLEREQAEQGIRKELLWALGKPDGASAQKALQAIAEFLGRGVSSGIEVWQGILSIERLSYSVRDEHLVPLLPFLREIRTQTLSFGSDDSRRAIASLFAVLNERGLSEL